MASTGENVLIGILIVLVLAGAAVALYFGFRGKASCGTSSAAGRMASRGLTGKKVVNPQVKKSAMSQRAQPDRGQLAQTVKESRFSSLPATVITKEQDLAMARPGVVNADKFASVNMQPMNQTGSQSCGVDMVSYRSQGGLGSAYNVPSYPDETDSSNLYAKGCNQVKCDNLNIDSLMPSSWKTGKPCDNIQSTDQINWAQYAPQKSAYEKQLTAAGSVRLAQNTRLPLARQTGIPNLLRNGSPVPVSGESFVFNDSQYRQSLYYGATGQYPTSSSC